MKRYRLRALMTEDGLELIRVPRRKKPKYQKLDPKDPINSEIIRWRINTIQNRLRALN